MTDKGFRITLKAARVNAGLTQQEAAKRLQISNSTLIKWEKTPEKIPGERLRQICEVYGISTDRVIFLPIN